MREASFPWHTASVETQRNWFRAVPEAAKAQRLVAIVDATVVGFAYGGLNYTAATPGESWVQLLVHPEFRGRGIGSALLGPTEAHLRSLGVVRAQSFCLEDAGILAWAQRRGYQPGAIERWSTVDPANLPPVPDAPANVTIMSAAEAGPEIVYAVDDVSFLDEPGDVPNAGMPYEDWMRKHWATIDHEASLVALVDGKPASITLVETNRSTGRAGSSGTGTLPEFRGMGLAKLLKSISLRKAAELGVTAAYTCNDYSNAPMLAVNDWLGYKVIGASRSVLKSF